MADGKSDPDCPRQFEGQPWSVWAEHIGRWEPIPDPPVQRRERGVTLLPREDMGLYGFCPEWDPFYTVVCNLCQAIVKPQGLSRHYEIRHPDFKVGSSRSVEGTETAETTVTVENLEITENKPEVSKTGTGAEGTVKIQARKSPIPSTSVSPSGSQSNICPSNVLPIADTTDVGSEGEPLPLQKENLSASPQQSPTCTEESASNQMSLQPVVVVSPLPSPSTLSTFMARIDNQLKTSTRPSTSSTTPRKRFKSERKCLPIKDREYDPDKHCGVWNDEVNKPCTRSLTCKSHSLSLRRAVVGRSKMFDRLLSEHRAAKESKVAKQPEQSQVSVPEVGTITSLPGTHHVVESSAVDDVPTATQSSSLSTPVSSDVPTSNLSSTSSYLSPMETHVPSLPDLAIDTFESQLLAPSKHPVLTAVVARFTPDNGHSPRPPEENAFRFSPKLEDVKWRKIHPKPGVISGLSARKCGGISWSGRRIGLFRHGLQTALTQGYIRIPLSNDYYGVPLQLSTNHATSAMKTVLTNISTKGNMLSVSNKLIGPNCMPSKSLQVSTNASSRKLNQIQSALSTTIVNSVSLKTVLPNPSVLAAKTTVNNSSSTAECALKNGQFHVPNILSASLKRPLETYKSNTGVNIKRSKRKNCINPAEVLSSLLARKNHISGTSNTVPLVTVALPNGVTVGNSGSSPGEGSDTKTMFTSRSVVVPEALLTDLPKAISSNNVATLPESTSSNSAVKAISQNVRIAAAPSTVQVASPQITYLTAGPVTFQQIPVLSSQLMALAFPLVKK